MKWILLIISLFLITGCSEKRVVENENNQKVDMEETKIGIVDTAPAGIEPEESERKVETSNFLDTQSKPEENNMYSNIEESQEKNENSEVTITPVPTKEVQTLQAIDSLEQEVTVLLAEEQTESLKEKIATKLITLVDFIYYDEPIGNVYFKDLTASAQEKVHAILTRMDHAIESKIPNYKDTLKEKYQKALNYVKTGIGNLTSAAGEKIESAMGSENYQNFVDAKDDMVESFQNTGKLIQEGASNIYQSGKEKVSNWYQGLKEKYEK